jgi:hypothetical protein
MRRFLKLTPVRALAIAAAVVAAILALTQLLLPPHVEGRIEDRLTENGGSAEATVRSVPALRLLLGDGSELAVRGSGLALDLTDEDTDVFDGLDGFGEVDIRLTDFRAGPLPVNRFTLARTGPGPYALRADATPVAQDLVDLTAQQVGGVSGSLLREFLGGVAEATVDPARRIPLRLEMEVEGSGGQVEVVSGGSTVAGFPTGPVGELIAEAVLARV